MAASENRRCPPGLPDASGFQASIASAASQSVTSPRWTSARSTPASSRRDTWSCTWDALVTSCQDHPRGGVQEASGAPRPDGRGRSSRAPTPLVGRTAEVSMRQSRPWTARASRHLAGRASARTPANSRRGTLSCTWDALSISFRDRALSIVRTAKISTARAGGAAFTHQRPRATRHPKERVSEPDPQAESGDLRLQEVLIERREALPVDLALDGEVVEDVGESEQQFGSLVQNRP